jgi:hypothetical protein
MRTLTFSGHSDSGSNVIETGEVTGTRPTSRTERYFRDFDITLRREGKSYLIEVTSPKGFCVRVRRSIKISEINSLVNKILSSKGSERDCQDLGRKCYDILFKGDVYTKWMRLRESIADPYANRILRVRLDIRDPALELIPWELVYDSANRSYPILDRRTPFVRCVSECEVAADTSFNNLSIIKVLVVVSQPQDWDRLDTDTEIANVLRSLNNEEIEFNILKNPTREALINCFDPRENYQIFHYVGHGKLADGESQLILEDKNRNSDPISVDDFINLIRGTGIRLLVLNGCETAAASTTDPLLTLAARAIGTGITTVVAMQGAIYDEVAITFSRMFYDKLAKGLPVEMCLTSARLAMKTQHQDCVSWVMPIQYTNLSEEGLCFSLGGSRSAPCPPQEPAMAAPPEARGPRGAKRFSDNLPAVPALPLVGREREILKLRQALLAGTPVVNVLGEKGVGRTAIVLAVAQQVRDSGSQGEGDFAGCRGIAWVSVERGPSRGGAREMLGVRWQEDVYLIAAKLLDNPFLARATPQERPIILHDMVRDGLFLLVLDELDEADEASFEDFVSNLPPSAKVIAISRKPLGIESIKVTIDKMDAELSLEFVKMVSEKWRIKEVAEADDAVLREFLSVISGTPSTVLLLLGAVRNGHSSFRDLLIRFNLDKARPPEVVYNDYAIKILSEDARKLFFAFSVLPRPTSVFNQGEIGEIGESRLRDAMSELAQAKLIKNEPPSQYSLSSSAKQLACFELSRVPGFERVLVKAVVARFQNFISDNIDERDRSHFDRLSAELENLLTVVHLALNFQEYDAVRRFRRDLEGFLYQREYWYEAILVGKLAFQAAELSGRSDEKAWAAIYPDKPSSAILAGSYKKIIEDSPACEVS